MQTIQKEIKERIFLCDQKGRLNPESIGWARLPHHTCNLKGAWMRKKRWDYWTVVNGKHLFSAAFAHLDYAVLAFVHLLDMESGEFFEHSVIKKMPSAKEFTLPNSAGEEVFFDFEGLRMNFQPDAKGTMLRVDCAQFQGSPLTAEILVLAPKAQESLNIVAPWSKRRFQFSSQQNCLPAQGRVEWGGRVVDFKKTGKNPSFAALDFGRGVWPFQTAWQRAGFAGKCGRDVLGLNMGAHWTDETGMNENGYCLNGKLFKIFDGMTFDFNPENYMAPWKVRTRSSEAVMLEFNPIHHHPVEHKVAFLQAQTHRVFGRWSGEVKVGGRKTLAVKELPGWVEDFQARW